MNAPRSSRCSACGRPLDAPLDPRLATVAWCSDCGDRRTADVDFETDAEASSDAAAGDRTDEAEQWDAETLAAPAVDYASVDAPTLDRPAAPSISRAAPAERRAGGAGERGGETKTPDRIGRFQIREAVGRGAFGTVYRAYDPVLDREVALKTPRFSDDDPATLDRFLREAKAAARLRHPNIVAVFESGDADGEPYIASEFVEGTPLSKRLRERPVEMRTAVDWCRQLALGLDYAHSEGVVHRDIKPANIMISRGGRPQVMDFGLAKRKSEEGATSTSEGAILGTPAYMSPEQARGEQAEVGPASDQYSVGVVLYEMLCARTPYQGDAWSIVSQVSDAGNSPPPPRSLRADLPPDLEACCLKALEKDPRARYPDLKSFAADLDNWLAGLPLVARPIGVVERLARWRRRNRLAAALLTAIATLTVVALVVGYLLAYQFRELANVAKRDAKIARDAGRRETIARRREAAARIRTEELLIDSYVESGLAADRKGDACEALLWFANAAALSESHPQRRLHNRIRFESWLAHAATPLHAFVPAGYWSESLQYHPSGRYLLCESLADACELRDLRSGDVVSLPLAGPLDCGAWNPAGDRLALAADRRLVLFEFPSGRELLRWDHADPIGCLAFSGDGNRLAVGGEKTAIVLDAADARPLTPPIPHDAAVLSVRLDRRGETLAGVGDDRRLLVHAVEGADRPLKPLIPPQPTAFEGKALPVLLMEGRRLVCVESGQGVRCWDLDRAEVVWRRDAPRVLALAVAPDQQTIAVGEAFDVVLLNAADGRPVGGRIAHRNLVNDLSFSPDGRALISASADETARLSRVPSGEPLVARIPHVGIVHRSVWSPDGSTVATVHWSDNLVRVWKVRGRAQTDYETPPDEVGSFLQFSADGRLAFSAGCDSVRRQRAIQVREASTGRAVGRAYRAPGPIGDATFVPGRPWLVAVGAPDETSEPDDVRRQNLERPGAVRFFNYETGEEPLPPLETPAQPIAVAASPGGDRLVVLCQRGQLLLLDGADGRKLAEVAAFDGVAADHGYVVRRRLRFSPDGRRFALWGAGTRVEVRSAHDAALQFAVRHKELLVHDVQFSPDGSRIASCSSDSTVRLWNCADGSPGPELPHAGWVFTAQFSRDGRRLLTASSDRQARLWEIDARRLLGATLAQTDEVYGVGFAASEEYFFLTTRDGQLCAYEPSFGRMLAPPRALRDTAFDLGLAADGARLLAAGRLRSIAGFDVAAWVAAPDEGLPAEDLRTLGELLSSLRIHESGAATGLARDEWLDRWRRFSARHPDHRLLQPDAPPAPPASAPSPAESPPAPTPPTSGSAP